MSTKTRQFTDNRAYNCSKHRWVSIDIATDVTDDKPQAIIDEATQVS